MLSHSSKTMLHGRRSCAAAKGLSGNCVRLASDTSRSRRASIATRANTGREDNTRIESRYLNHIQAELELVDYLKKKLHISDVISSVPSPPGSTKDKDEDFQWVDLVMAGGGLLGIAHVGFVCVLEKAGVRFRSIGGTSAGAINAIVVAAVREDPTVESWADSLKLLSTAPFGEFQDGDDCKTASALIKSVLGSGGQQSGKWSVISKIPGLLFELPRIWKRRGIHPGVRFQEWVRREILAPNNIKTVADLRQKMDVDKAGFRIRPGAAGFNLSTRMATTPEALKDVDLKLVASDVTTQTKVVFPDDANLYYSDPDSCDPSAFVRASMSVPLFFQPFEITGIPTGDANVQAAWKKTKWPGDVPERVTMVDGGTLSNFPISLFDTPGVPLLPTIGCQLGVPRAVPQGTSNPIELYKAMNNTSRHIGDYDFLLKNPIYEPLVATADTSEFGWLNFDMAEDEKMDLFKEGARAGINLLIKFQGPDQWEKIKELRRRPGKEKVVKEDAPKFAKAMT